MLGEERGSRAVRQLRRFRDLQELDLPVILLVGGGTGTGKSTVATEVAYRLGITRVTSTDFVRQTMRAFFAKEFMPSIHYSSFEAGLGLSKAEEEESGDAALLGFLDQTRNVLTGVEAALQRALDEGWSMVLEGVHLVPGMITTELQGALVVHCVLAIRDEEIHRTHFWIRDATTDGMRPVDRYIAGLPEIRMIQEYVLERRGAGRRTGDRERVAERGGQRGHESRARAGGARRRAGRSMSERRRGTCPCALFARATEWAALAGARWLGRDDQDAAEDAANGAMLAGLAGLPISGTIVIGSDQGIELEAGSSIGVGGESFDLAVDPLEGRGVVARGGNGAMSMIVVGPPGSLLKLPDMYMRRMAVGPRARGRIDLTRPVGENVAAIAEAFGRNANDITALVLDRPRHHDLIEEIRAAGARIKLIQDGDVTASISAAIRGTNDHLAIGIGGTRQAVLSAAALRCLGGELQSQLWPTTRGEIDERPSMGWRTSTASSPPTISRPAR